MTTTVVKPFKSALQRFVVGQTVTEADDLSPQSVESLKSAGYLADDTAIQPASISVEPDPAPEAVVLPDADPAPAIRKPSR